MGEGLQNAGRRNGDIFVPDARNSRKTKGMPEEAGAVQRVAHHYNGAGKPAGNSNVREVKK